MSDALAAAAIAAAGQVKFSSWPEVTVDGTPIPDALYARMSQVSVDLELHRPAMFDVTFEDTKQDALTSAGIRVGSKLLIEAHSLGSSALQKLLSGEVTALRAQYRGGRGQLHVTGYDLSNRLQRGRQTHTYQNVKISDVAQTIAGRAGLATGTIDDSGDVLDHVSQANCSDWEFLSGWARHLGFELGVGVTDGNLNFRKPVQASTGPGPGDDTSSNPTQLVYGRDLLEFHPTFSSAQQPTGVQLRSWDPASKSVLVGSAAPAAAHADAGTDTQSLAQPFGSPTHVVHDRPVDGQSEADAAAGALAERLGRRSLQAKGVCLGNAQLAAGTAVSVAGVADPFNGRFTLSKVTHRFGTDGYRTEFSIGGAEDHSLLGAVTAAGSAKGAASTGGKPVNGVMIGLVTNNDDPKQLGRVKVKFPCLSDGYESDWAWVTQVGAGPDSGFVFLPEKDDEVLCAFESGDLRRPYVIGFLHNGQDTPNLGNSLINSGKVKRRGVVSRRGHKLIFLEDDSKSGIALISSDGNLRVALNETDGEIHIHCKGKVSIDTDSDQITIKSGADVSIEAQGNLHLKGGSGVKLESSAVVEVSGQMIKLN